MAGKKGLKKRVWADDEKCRICEQTLTPGVSVAQVARRYAMNANLIHKWLRDPRFSPNAPDDNPVPAEATTFLPVEIEGVASAPTTPSMADPLSAHRVDITLSDGRRILVEGSTALLVLQLRLMPRFSMCKGSGACFGRGIDDLIPVPSNPGPQPFAVERSIGGERRVYTRRHRPKPPETDQALPDNGPIRAGWLRNPISPLFKAINSH